MESGDMNKTQETLNQSVANPNLCTFFVFSKHLLVEKGLSLHCEYMLRSDLCSKSAVEGAPMYFFF
jgi:hypothetical protein